MLSHLIDDNFIKGRSAHIGVILRFKMNIWELNIIYVCLRVFIDADFVYIVMCGFSYTYYYSYIIISYKKKGFWWLVNLYIEEEIDELL